MVVRPNNCGKYAEYGHFVVCMGEVVSTRKGIIAKDCSYVDANHQVIMIDIPLFLLWRIADDEDLLAMHEGYIQYENLQTEHIHRS